MSALYAASGTVSPSLAANRCAIVKSSSSMICTQSCPFPGLMISAYSVPLQPGGPALHVGTGFDRRSYANVNAATMQLD